MDGGAIGGGLLLFNTTVGVEALTATTRRVLHPQTMLRDHSCRVAHLLHRRAASKELSAVSRSSKHREATLEGAGAAGKLKRKQASRAEARRSSVAPSGERAAHSATSGAYPP
jgi:hypothetical protein